MTMCMRENETETDLETATSDTTLGQIQRVNKNLLGVTEFFQVYSTFEMLVRWDACQTEATISRQAPMITCLI